MALLAVVLLGAGGIGIWALSARQPTPPAVPVPDDWTLLPDGARAAITEAVAACRARPDDAAAFEMLGSVYHGNSEPALAIAAYERALELGADEARTPYLLGLLYEDWGRTDQALDRLGLALTRDAG